MAQRTPFSWNSCRHALPAPLLFAALVALGAPTDKQLDAAMSCFTIAGEVTCFESGGAHVQPVAPNIAPSGPIFGGESEEIVMRDNGGHVVERG